MSQYRNIAISKYYNTTTLQYYNYVTIFQYYRFSDSFKNIQIIRYLKFERFTNITAQVSTEDGLLVKNNGTTNSCH